VTGQPAPTFGVPGEDVAEACADALLAACAQVIMLRDPLPDPPSIYEARDLAENMLDRVIVRTIAEGGKPH
jgi:hypothetical protein